MEPEPDHDRPRCLGVCLAASATRPHARDPVAERVFPALADACAPRRVAFSVLDLRRAEGDAAGPGADTLRARLAEREACQAVRCVVDPDRDAALSVSHARLAFNVAALARAAPADAPPE